MRITVEEYSNLLENKVERLQNKIKRLTAQLRKQHDLNTELLNKCAEAKDCPNDCALKNTIEKIIGRPLNKERTDG